MGVIWRFSSDKRATDRAMTDNPTQHLPPVSERLCSVLALIPTGTVVTYGQMAALIGLPGAARVIGQHLNRLPQDTQLPWHRIINAQGRLSFTPLSDHYLLQKQRLENEGVVFINGKIDLKCYQWRPS